MAVWVQGGPGDFGHWFRVEAGDRGVQDTWALLLALSLAPGAT